ncbi:unnamed protein product [Ectocarpus sp. 12 AP-2014]
MAPSLSSSLVIGLKGEDLGSLVGSVAEFGARGVRPTGTFCDRAMQALCNSKCRFQTEYLRRLMTSSLEAFPGCWQPLNWSRFDEALQDLVVGKDPLALGARAAYLGIVLDSLETSRRQRQEAAGGGARGGSSSSSSSSGVPPLLLGAGGDRDGRTALKQCTKWAARVWAHRHAGVAEGAANAAAGGRDYDEEIVNTRVCMTASRALAEALEAFRMAAGELEGCRLAAVILESESESNGGKEAARGLAGLMRSLSGRTFCSALAGVLLENMPEQQQQQGGGVVVEVEKLKALLRRQAAVPMGAVSAGGGRRGSRAKVVGGGAGSAMLFANMDAESN